MYYINSLFLYSLLGFVMESTVYKINKSKRHSGICYGPVTYVYGFGILSLILLDKYFLKRLKGNRFWKVLITFVVCWVTLTFIEWLGGTILNQIFDINMWDYSKKAYHCGRYICLELSFIWGILGTLYLYFVKDFMDQIIALIPKKLTYTLLLIQAIDVIFVFLHKLP